jgi:hypothetical protein
MIRPCRIYSPMFGESDRLLTCSGPASTTLSMLKVAERALEHDDEEVPRLASQLLAELERSPASRRQR